MLFASAIVIISLALSLASVRTSSLNGVTQCAAVGSCEGSRANDKGTHTVKQWGFPSTYRTVDEFEPSNTQHYASVSTVSQSTNLFLVITNIIFWASFLTVVYVGVKNLSTQRLLGLYKRDASARSVINGCLIGVVALVAIALTSWLGNTEPNLFLAAVIGGVTTIGVLSLFRPLRGRPRLSDGLMGAYVVVLAGLQAFYQRDFSVVLLGAIGVWLLWRAAVPESWRP
jgi:hypothetical protein